MVELLFTQHGLLFLLLIISNIVDWLTGWAKARISKSENSTAGFMGIIRKTGMWILVFVSFLLAYAFIELGTILNIDMGMAQFIGWFTVLTLIVNEIRSILENLLECKISVPKILVRGLEIFDDKIDDLISDKEEEV